MSSDRDQPEIETEDAFKQVADEAGEMERVRVTPYSEDRAEIAAREDPKDLTPEEVLENKGRKIIPRGTEGGLRPEVVYEGDDDEMPGEYPYTRGAYPKQYREMLWTSGVIPGGTIFDSEHGVEHYVNQGIISTAMRHVSSAAEDMCVDPDHPLAKFQGASQPVNPAVLDQVPGDRVGNPPIERFVDEGIIYEYNNANATEAFLVTQHVAYLEERGIPIENLRGSVVNDPLNHNATIECKDLQPWDVLYKLGTDFMEFGFEELPGVRPTNAGNGYDIRESGVDLFEELAFVFTAYIDYMDEMVDRGLDIRDIHHQPPLALSGDIDFFETVCKLRAARRINSKIISERYGVDPEEVKCRPANTNLAGRAMTENNHTTNIVRNTIAALASVLGGVNGMEAKTYTEASSPPPEEAWVVNEKDIRGVIAHESGAPLVADPLGGSTYVENLTDEIEERTMALIDEIQSRGGLRDAAKNGWLLDRARASRQERWEEMDKHEQNRVGQNLNRSVNEYDLKLPMTDIDHGTWEEPRTDREKKHLEEVEAVRQRRDVDVTVEPLEDIYDAVRNDENMTRPMIEAWKKDATRGEVTGALRLGLGYDWDEWGMVDRPDWLTFE